MGLGSFGNPGNWGGVDDRGERDRGFRAGTDVRILNADKDKRGKDLFGRSVVLPYLLHTYDCPSRDS